MTSRPLYLDGLSVECIFADQGSGGAVYVLVTSLNRLANHNVHVQDCLFSGNTAASSESISASFPRCWSSFMSLWAGGGALSIARNAAASVNDSLLSITGCLFERNTALEGLDRRLCDCLCEFDGARHVGNGGAIDIDYSAILNSVILMANVQIVLDNCTLFGNTALDGDCAVCLPCTRHCLHAVAV